MQNAVTAINNNNNHVNINESDLKFRDYSNILISGCTQSGKTEFVTKLISNADKMFNTQPEICIFTYSHWQKAYDKLQRCWKDRIIFTDEIPSADFLHEIMNGKKHGLFVLDDKASELPNSAFFMDLLTRYGHHYKLSNIVLVQDPSLQGKMKSILSKNFHVNVLMRSPRDRSYVKALGIMLNDYSTLTAAYDDACAMPFGYLVLDLHPLANSLLKYRTNVFPQDQHCVVYRKKQA